VAVLFSTIPHLIRALSLSLSLVVASVVIFALIEVIPGDPASFMLGLNATDETLAALRAELGLDGSKLERYFAWIGGMLTGRFRHLLHLPRAGGGAGRSTGSGCRCRWRSTR
jgi:ABC-type dipeptide/oligopeptide/nickel transport system permease component